MLVDGKPGYFLKPGEPYIDQFQKIVDSPSDYARAFKFYMTNLNFIQLSNIVFIKIQSFRIQPRTNQYDQNNIYTLNLQLTIQRSNPTTLRFSLNGNTIDNEAGPMVPLTDLEIPIADNAPNKWLYFGFFLSYGMYGTNEGSELVKIRKQFTLYANYGGVNYPLGS